MVQFYIIVRKFIVIVTCYPYLYQKKELMELFEILTSSKNMSFFMNEFF